MTASHDWQLFFQAWALGMALWLTFELLVQIVCFYVNATRNGEAKMGVGQSLMPALFWAVFFWLIRAQF
jgi:hypothetical protein